MSVLIVNIRNIDRIPGHLITDRVLQVLQEAANHKIQSYDWDREPRQIYPPSYFYNDKPDNGELVSPEYWFTDVTTSSGHFRFVETPVDLTEVPEGIAFNSSSYLGLASIFENFLDDHGVGDVCILLPDAIPQSQRQNILAWTSPNVSVEYLPCGILEYPDHFRPWFAVYSV
jgi:hypothetical protein